MTINRQKGFTLIETLVVIAIFLFFIGLTSVNILNIEPTVSLNINTASIIADIRNQQLKAMTGSVYSGLPSDFGIYFQQGSYTLFAGNSYQPGHASNVNIPYPNNTTMSATSFPAGTLVFLAGKGGINNFSEGSNTVTFTNSVSNEEKTIIFNKLGVITGVI